MAVLAAYAAHTDAGRADARSLGEYLTTHLFADAAVDVVAPDADDVAGYAAFLERYTAGLAIERAATDAV